MISTYTDIYARFLMKIRDYEFCNLSEADASEAMKGWLIASVSHPYVYRIFGSFAADDETGTLDYTLVQSVDAFSDKNFIEELLSCQMVCEWLSPKLKSTTLLNQMITNSKEQKFYAQQAHIEQMRALVDDSEGKVRGMLRDRGYLYNDYLRGS